MDLHIKPLARQSSISNELFVPGQNVHSLLILEEDNNFVRYDLTPQEAMNFKPQGSLLCRWIQGVKEAGIDTDVSEQEMALQTAEAIFEALCDDVEEENSNIHEERMALQHLLALHLERKRILRSSRRNGKLIYRNTRKDTEYILPEITLTPDLLLKIQEQLQALV